MMNDFVFVSTIQTCCTFKENQTFLIFNPPYSIPPYTGKPWGARKDITLPSIQHHRQRFRMSRCPDGIWKPRRGRYQPIKKLEVADISVQGKFLNKLANQKAMTNQVYMCHKLKKNANKCVNNVFRILIFKADIFI